MPFQFGDRVRITHPVMADDGQTLPTGAEGLVVNDGKDRGENAYYIGFNQSMQEGVKSTFATVLENGVILAGNREKVLRV